MRRLLLVGSAAVVLAAWVFAVQGNWPWTRYEPATPSLSLPSADPIPEPILDTLRRGETISDLFTRQGVPGFEFGQLARSIGWDPRRMRAGLVFSFFRHPHDSLPVGVTVRTGPEERIRLYRASTGWTGVREAVRWSPEVIRLGASIQQSLYTALDAAVPDSMLDSGARTQLAWAVADIYAWNLDFSRDIQPGDSLTVLIERLVSEEGEVRFGRVLAGEMQASGKRLSAWAYRDAQGRTGFYDDDAESLRRAFLRAPVEFRRISSNFSRARFHPILKIRRRHEGTDYSASAGTPVMAAGDGRVVTAGRSGGYGNLVEVRHRNGITTRYAHLRGFARGIRAGSVVQQGDVIGYVGATGLASAPHLHYEFRVNGVAQDSRRVLLTQGAPLESELRPAFFAERDRLQALLRGIRAPGLPPSFAD